MPCLQLPTPGGKVSGMQNPQILRGVKTNVRALRKVLASLGAPPRRLMTCVRRNQRRIWVGRKELN